MVVRQLIDRGPLTKANVDAIVQNCGKPFSWAELRWLACCRRRCVTLRSELSLQRRLKHTPKLPLNQLTQRERMLARMAQRRLAISIYQGIVSKRAVYTKEALLKKMHCAPGTPLLKAAQYYPDAAADIAALCREGLLTTHDGRLWASPGPPFNQQCAQLWAAAHQ